MIRAFCCLSLLLILPASASAAPTITCHCFTDRSYDPSHPALADPYFLATTQNSFFAVVFNIDKKTVVMKKQTGSSADDLWIAYWVGAKSGMAGETLLAARVGKKSWKEVLVPLGLPAQSIGERLSNEVTAGASAARLAQIIVDDVLIRNRLLGEREVGVLRKERASNQEVIIAVLIAAKTRRPAVLIYQEVKKGTKSWGALLSDAKLQSANLQTDFATLLKAPPH